MPAFLAVRSGLPAQALTLPRGASIIGRGTGADIQLTHPEISRQHCRVTWDGQSCSVEDLDSARGTVVNGRGIFAATAGASWR
jgi:pSer/pThr/pTyr-binding forkhead associated (FHA) protein